MIWVDYVIIAVIALSALIGLARGLIREVLSLVIWVAAAGVAWVFHRPLADQLTPWLSTPTVRIGVAFVILVFVVLILGAISGPAPDHPDRQDRAHRDGPPARRPLRCGPGRRPGGGAGLSGGPDPHAGGPLVEGVATHRALPDPGGPAAGADSPGGRRPRSRACDPSPLSRASRLRLLGALVYGASPIRPRSAPAQI